MPNMLNVRQIAACHLCAVVTLIVKAINEIGFKPKPHKERDSPEAVPLSRWYALQNSRFWISDVACKSFLS